MRNTIIAMTFFQITAASLLYAQEEPSNQETAKPERAPVAATISDGKRTEFGFVSHTIDCPTYFAPYGQNLTETIEVLTPDKMVEGKRYPVIYALDPLTSRMVKAKLGNRYYLGPLMDIREQDLHNKHQVICIKVMAIHRHMNWKYLEDVVVPYVDRTYPTIAEPRGRMLLGFSKTGEDVWKLLLANPEIFGKACSWDGPAPWEFIEPHAEILRRDAPPRLILTGGSGSGLKLVPALHQKLAEEGIPHLYHFKALDSGDGKAHHWSSGWIADAMRLLFKDFKRAESPSDMDKARMEAAVQFAETALKYGRDTYGEKHTPLFTDVLDIDTMTVPEKIYICHLCGNPCPRQDQPWQPLVSSNLAYQGNLMRFLAGLSNLTGDSKYKEAYKDSIRYYFKHYQTVSGVLSMGHHRFIDLKADDYDGDNWPPGDRGHEMKGDIPYYDLFWETDPKATHKMLTGHWSSHIKNWVTMDFTRHGNFNKPLDEGIWGRPVAEPVKGIVKGDLTFFNSASDIIWAGGKLSQLAEDDRARIWAQRLLARYIDSAHPDTGIPPCHHTFVRDFGEEGKSWPEYAMLFSDELFASGATMLMRLGDLLGDRGTYFKQSVHQYLKAYVKHAYNPEDNTLRNILYDGTDLSVYDRKDGVSRGWIWKAHSGYMISFALCYRQTRDKEIWDTLRAMARGNDLGDIGEAGGTAPELNLATHQGDPGLIFALVELFCATDNRVYLDLARVIGNNALRQQFNAEKGLFVASDLERIADLNASEPLAFITLEAALRGKLDRVPTYDGSVATSPSGGILRPSRVLPYHPTASHCWYPDTVLALCDELVPDGSNDSRIPRMSWYRISRLDGPRGTALATFPDILTGPVTVTDVADSANARNRLGGIIIDSPFSYTFGPSGCLQMSEDFTITVIQGDHTMQAINWQPMGTIDYVLDVAAGGRFTFAGLIYEYPGHRPENVAGLVKNGDGTAVVTGDYGPRYSANLRDNRAYRGETVINKGVLLVNNATGSGISPRSAVQVKDGGTLGGHGAIGNGGTSAIVNVHAGGTIAPGSDVGTLTVRDGLTLHDGAKLACELGKTGDLLKVTGGTFIGSSKGGVSVSVADAGTIEMGKTYDLIDWTGATPSGVDVEDFVADRASKYSGTFHISGSRLQIKITGSTALPVAKRTVTPETMTARTTPAKTTAKTRATHTWINPDGGSWADHANWHEGVIPNGTPKEWVQYSFEKPRQVSSVEVYWLDDNGANRVPESWRVLYRHAGAWTPAEAVGEYCVAKDRFNKVEFKPVVTDRLRLEVKLQPGLFGGILEWRVNP